MRLKPPRAARYRLVIPIAALLVGVWACQNLDAAVQAPGPFYSVGGSITGARGPLTVACDAGSQVIAGNGSFTCDGLYLNEGNYSVRVVLPPSGQACSVSGGGGGIAAANITTVAIVCGASGADGNTITSPTPTPTPAPTPTPTPTPTSTGTASGPTGSLWVSISGSITGASLMLSVDGRSFTVVGNGNVALTQGTVGNAYHASITQAGPGLSCQITSGATGVYSTSTSYVVFACARLMNFSDNPSASHVVGQSSFNNNGQNSLHAPVGAAVSADGTYLYISDTVNQDVVATLVPVIDNSTFYFSIGSGLQGPRGIGISSSKTAIASANSNQVFIYNGELKGDRGPDVVIGGSNPSYCSPLAMYRPSAAFLFGDVLFVADTGANRVMIYSSVPTASTTSNQPMPTIILGQNGSYNCQRNNGSSNATSSTLNGPTDVWTDGTTLVVADAGNNRLLLWSPLPTTPGNGAPATAVLGQQSMSQSGAGTSPSALNNPSAVVSDGTTIFVSDTYNNRILGFPYTGGAGSNATVYIGQNSFYNGNTNAGGSPSSQTLSQPSALTFAGTALVVADTGNNRVLTFNSN